MTVLTSVGSAERLNVMSGTAMLVDVLLKLPGRPAVAVSDGCSCDDQVEFVDTLILAVDASVSLAGIWVPEVSKGLVLNPPLDVRMCVWLAAAPVTELKKENATVLKSGALNLMLET